VRFLTAALLLSFIAVSFFGAPYAHAPALADMPGGPYTLDRHHTSITFKISHLGFSHFTGRFDKFDGVFTYNPTAPEQSTLDVTIYPDSIDTNDSELDEDLRGENWFNPIKFPHATFHSTHMEPMSDGHAKITGDFTLHGMTHEMILDIVLVGAGEVPFTGEKVIGISASGAFDRSAYGISNLEPMVGDEVSLQIESEFDKE
jgi:polyisoprenoid-binding protein YceI